MEDMLLLPGALLDSASCIAWVMVESIFLLAVIRIQLDKLGSSSALGSNEVYFDLLVSTSLVTRSESDYISVLYAMECYPVDV